MVNQGLRSSNKPNTPTAENLPQDEHELRGVQGNTTAAFWERVDKIVVLVVGGIALGGTFYGSKGSVIGAAVCLLYGCYTFGRSK